MLSKKIEDHLRLLKVFYRASFRTASKSPLNLWIATFIQLFYYVAQIAFWVGVRSTPGGAQFISDSELIGFLLTVAVVDNAYLFALGAGSIHLAQRIQQLSLEPLLLMPRSTLGILLFSRPSFSYLPCLVWSVCALVAYHITAGTDFYIVVVHFIATLSGIFVLTGISYLHRLTVFWTDSIVNIRNSNPSFKILVRPPASFRGPVRFALMTIFPALFITGVPFEILSGSRSSVWMVGVLAAALLLWLYVGRVWKIGVKRYARYAT